MILSRTHSRSRFSSPLRVTMVLRALTTPAARRPRRSSRSVPMALPGALPDVRRGRAQGSARASTISPGRSAGGSSAGSRDSEGRTTARGSSRPACTRRRPSACSERSSSSPSLGAFAVARARRRLPVARPAHAARHRRRRRPGLDRSRRSSSTRAARKRREQVERALPDLIDLLVVTLEAGLSFPQSLRLAAPEDQGAARVARSD